MAQNSITVGWSVIQFGKSGTKVVRALNQRLIYDFLEAFDKKNLTIHSIFGNPADINSPCNKIFEKIREYMYQREDTILNVLGDIKYICHEASNIQKFPVMYMHINREHLTLNDDFYVMIYYAGNRWETLTIAEKLYETGNFSTTEYIWGIKG